MNFFDYVISYFVLGAASGLLSGLLGIGGGIVIVPGLHFLFLINRFPPATIMHMSIGTSFAVMVPTTLRAFLSHRKALMSALAIFKRMLIGIVVGTIFGCIIAHFLHSYWLRMMFSVLLVLVSLNLFFSDLFVFEKKPNKRIFSIVSILIGLFSSMLGIGGSTFVIPFLLSVKVDMRIAIVVAVLVGLVVSILSCVSYVVTGLHAVGLPAHAIGYVYWPAALAAAVMSFFFAPLGAYFSRQVSRNTLRKIFAFILMLIAIHSFVALLN